MASKIPRGAVTATKHAPQKEAAHKPQKENAPRKNVASKVYQGVSTRYEVQAELEEQKKNLTAANEQLQRNLTDTRLRVDELERRVVEQEQEKAELQKNLKDCYMLLVAAKVDPVSGEQVGDAAQEREAQKEVMSVSVDLLDKMNDFSSVASQQRSQLQEIKDSMQALAVARDHMTHERENFSVDVEDLARALEEAEVVLM